MDAEPASSVAATRLTNAEIGARLRTLRTAKGVSPKELAARATPLLAGAPQARQGFLDRQMVEKVERGYRALKYSEAVAIAAVLEVELTDFDPNFPTGENE